MWKSILSIFTTPMPAPGANISYTTHKILENTGPIIEVSQTLSPDIVSETINTCEGVISPQVKSSRSIIIDSISSDSSFHNPEFMKQISGIFIHNADRGFLMIKNTNAIGDNVISIKI